MSLTLYDAKILGAAVKDARSKRHLTQAECAELLEVSPVPKRYRAWPLFSQS